MLVLLPVGLGAKRFGRGMEQSASPTAEQAMLISAKAMLLLIGVQVPKSP